MFYTPRRRIAVLALILSLSPTITGCMGTTQVPLGASTDLTRVTGVISRSGINTVFAAPGATIANDTLYAIGKNGQLVLPVDSIATVRKPTRSIGRSVALAFGLVAGGVAALAIAVASSDFLSHR